MYSIPHYVKKYVSDLRQVDGFLRFPPPKKTEHHDITEIFLKVALNTITQTLTLYWYGKPEYQEIPQTFCKLLTNVTTQIKYVSPTLHINT